MKKITKNVLKIVSAIIIIIAILLAKFAWAKYITKIEGEASADIAHFSFTISEKSSDSLTIDLAKTRLPNDTTSVEGTTVAPGTKGALAFDINAKVSEVSLEYDIDIDVTDVPQNLIFYYDERMTNAIYHYNNKININGFFKENMEDKTATRVIYWYWPLETGQSKSEIDRNDEIDSTSMGDLITIDIKVVGQQVKIDPTTNKHAITFDANGGIINGYGNSEMMTKTVTSEQYGELPESKKLGYTFEGWYTDKTEGEKISSNTSAEEDVIYYAQYTPNSYTVTINPNGGTYKSQMASIQVTQNCDTLLGLEDPVREGYTFDGWNIAGGGSMQRGIPFGNELREKDRITGSIQEDYDGSKYTKYTLNVTNGSTGYTYPFIRWPSYNYISGHQYRISAYIRTNALSGLWYSAFRHAAIPNDCATPATTERKTRPLNVSCDFIEYTLTRTFTGNKIMNGDIEHNIEPLIEIYFAIEAGSTGIVDFDVKNITVYDITANEYVTTSAYGGYIYKYGSENATLTAKWIKNN